MTGYVPNRACPDVIIELNMSRNGVYLPRELFLPLQDNRPYHQLETVREESIIGQTSQDMERWDRDFSGNAPFDRE